LEVATQDTIAAEGNGSGEQMDQFLGPRGLAFDGEDSIYVVLCLYNKRSYLSIIRMILHNKFDFEVY
jgi:hypothetical protein